MLSYLHMGSVPKPRRGGTHALDVAAYRTGAVFQVPAGPYEPQCRRTRDHRGRSDIRFCQIITPQGTQVPPWVWDRQLMWTQADNAENRKNSRIAREWTIAIPRGLPRRQANRLAKAIARKIANRYGCIVDLSFHDGIDRFGRPQPHVHLLCTTRRIEPHGFGNKTTIEWSETALKNEGLASGSDQITIIRRQIAELTNAELTAAGIEHRVEYRSYRKRGLDVIASGRPKRHGKRSSVTRRQLARLRRNTSGPGVSELDRRRLNAASIASDPALVLRMLGEPHSALTTAAITDTLAPHVPSEAISDLSKVIVEAYHVAGTELVPVQGNTDCAPQNSLHPVCASTAALGKVTDPEVNEQQGNSASNHPSLSQRSDHQSPEPQPAKQASNGITKAGPAVTNTASPDLDFEFDELPGAAEAAERMAAKEVERERKRAEGATLWQSYRELRQADLNEIKGILARLAARPGSPQEEADEKLSSIRETLNVDATAHRQDPATMLGD